MAGYSYGGSVITAAGTADNVVGLVHISGFAPDAMTTFSTSDVRISDSDGYMFAASVGLPKAFSDRGAV